MKRLASYLCGKWMDGQGGETQLVNPTTEVVIAEATSKGLDLKAAVEFARDKGGSALRQMTFAERGAMLRSMSQAMHAAREELIELAVQNGGNTRGDAKFDIDGASATLAAYADLGEKIGKQKILADGDAVQVGRTARLSGQHVYLPRRGIAAHINAFNFPAWGLAEKAATALLAGMPVLSKPATTTALVAHRVMEIFVDKKLLPDGALSFLCGNSGDLLDHLYGQDVLAFTGSSQTAAILRKHPCVVERSVHINVEADSLNAAVLAPDVEIASETGQLFLADVVRDMTQKTGQKCTAIRRVLVPESLVGQVSEEISSRLVELKIGDPGAEGIRMGPVATRAQRDDVKAGIARLSKETDAVFGTDGSVQPIGVPAGKGFFVGPVVRLSKSADKSPAVHNHEVFGPVTTLCMYSGDAVQACNVVQAGQGGLVASIYSDDREFVRTAVTELGPFHGRLYLGSAKMAAQSPGPGTALPSLLHGGPGRAGGGEELGGQRGMSLYQQRVALQGDSTVLASFLTSV